MPKNDENNFFFLYDSRAKAYVENDHFEASNISSDEIRLQLSKISLIKRKVIEKL